MRPLTFLAVVWAAGCATSGPRVTATADLVQYAHTEKADPTAHPVTLVRLTGQGRPVQVTQWTHSKGGQYQVSLRGRDPQACYAVIDARGRLVKIRNDTTDPHSFWLPRHAEVARRLQEYQRLQQEGQRLTVAAANAKHMLAEAKHWLTRSRYFRAGGP